jgi:putative ABC transport system permease protein
VNGFLLVRKNLFRKKLRTGLMIASILIAFAIFGVLAGFYRAFSWREGQAAADRLIVANKINFTLPLPIAYFNRVRAVEGVRQATYASWFGGYHQDPKNFVVAMAVDPETYFDIYSSWFDIPEAVRQGFVKERTGAVVGEELARRRGWKVGDRIPISSTMFFQRNGSSTWDFTIVGLFRGRTPEISTNSMVFQYAYFDETRSLQKHTIGWMVLQTTSPSVNDRVAKTVDQMFANSSAETSCDTEKAFSRASAAQRGNVALVVTLVIGAAFVTILMIVGNTMALSIRERTREIGVLKTLGFSGGRILALVLGETLLLALLGGLPGIALAALATGVLRRSLGNVVPTLAVTPDIALIGVGLMVALGFLTGIIPAVNAMRLKIATALGRN